MDLISKPVIEMTTLALDGLSARHKVLSSNIANANTPGFKRSDVNFGDQLNKIMQTEDAKQKEKEDYSTSLMYYPNSITSAGDTDVPNNFIDTEGKTKSSYENFQPEIAQTNEANVKPDGNNVNIEHEMAELTQNGMRYTALSTLQANLFKSMQEAIKGGGM